MEWTSFDKKRFQPPIDIMSDRSTTIEGRGGFTGFLQTITNMGEPAPTGITIDSRLHDLTFRLSKGDRSHLN
ncbi:hypothetical protein QUA81_15475 [Microcoleus sp. F6_B4]